jgi:hypothetical protein
VSFSAVTPCVASQHVFVVVSVYFVIDTVRKRLDTPSYTSLSCVHHSVLIGSILFFMVYSFPLNKFMSTQISGQSVPFNLIPCHPCRKPNFVYVGFYFKSSHIQYYSLQLS